MKNPNVYWPLILIVAVIATYFLSIKKSADCGPVCTQRVKDLANKFGSLENKSANDFYNYLLG